MYMSLDLQVVIHLSDAHGAVIWNLVLKAGTGVVIYPLPPPPPPAPGSSCLSQPLLYNYIQVLVKCMYLDSR